MHVLSTFIERFVAGRRQTKLDAFDKEMVKRLAAGEHESDVLTERRELELRYGTQAWLSRKPTCNALTLLHFLRMPIH